MYSMMALLIPPLVGFIGIVQQGFWRCLSGPYNKEDTVWPDRYYRFFHWYFLGSIFSDKYLIIVWI